MAIGNLKVKLDKYLSNENTEAELLAAVAQATGKPTFAAEPIRDSEGKLVSLVIGLSENPSAADLTNAQNAASLNSGVVTASKFPISEVGTVDALANDSTPATIGTTFPFTIIKTPVPNATVIPSLDSFVRDTEGVGGAVGDKALCLETVHDGTATIGRGNFRFNASHTDPINEYRHEMFVKYDRAPVAANDEIYIAQFSVGGIDGIGYAVGTFGISPFGIDLRVRSTIGGFGPLTTVTAPTPGAYFKVVFQAKAGLVTLEVDGTITAGLIYAPAGISFDNRHSFFMETRGKTDTALIKVCLDDRLTEVLG